VAPDRVAECEPNVRDAILNDPLRLHWSPFLTSSAHGFKILD